MNTIRHLFFLFSFFVFQALAAMNQEAPNEKSFVIVIPSHNNSDWYQKNLDSVFNQRYTNFRIIYISDGSTDGTAELVENYVKQWGQDHRFTLIKNLERHGALSCICRAIFSCEKNEIIVDLDGNDWLAHDQVLSILNRTYEDPDVWMTYGQFMFFPEYARGFASQVPKEIIEKNKFRSHGGAITHLKTFYAGLFHLIKKQDFLYENAFIPEAYDLAYIIPIAELAGRHSKFIPHVLSIYNRSHPLNLNKKPSWLEEEMDKYIRSLEKYEPLETLAFLNKEDLLPPNSVYKQIQDIRHPTINDYRLIQNYLTNGERPELDHLRDMEARIRDFKLIGQTPRQFPQSGCIHVNCSETELENCILVYASFNIGFQKAAHRLIKLIKESDFRGHILFQLGGWPDAEGGSLVLSHVPYAFKVSFFKEAQRKGYKRALWLDTAVVPLASLNDIFAMIKEKGYFAMGNSHKVGPYINPQAAVYFGLSHEKTFHIPSCSAGLFGVDFTNPLGCSLVERLYRAAYDKDAFFSARSDQSALSIILFQASIHDLISLDRLPHHPSEIRSDSLFWLDREFVIEGD